MGQRDDYIKEVPEDRWQNLGFPCPLAGLIISGAIWGIAKLFGSPGCVVSGNMTRFIQACGRQSLFS